jgi:hypothetical protein
VLLPLPSGWRRTRPFASVPAPQAAAAADPLDRRQPRRAGTAAGAVHRQPLGERRPLAAGGRKPALTGGHLLGRSRLRSSPQRLVGSLFALLPADAGNGAGAARPTSPSGCDQQASGPGGQGSGDSQLRPARLGCRPGGRRSGSAIS